MRNWNFSINRFFSFSFLQYYEIETICTFKWLEWSRVYSTKGIELNGFWDFHIPAIVLYEDWNIYITWLKFEILSLQYLWEIETQKVDTTHFTRFYSTYEELGITLVC